MILRHGNAFYHRQNRNVRCLVIFKAEDRNRIGMRHLPQAKDSQQDQRASIKLVSHRTVANDRRRSAGKTADQRTVD